MRVKTIEWKNDQVVMLDQRLLPHKEINRVCRDYKEVAAAARLLSVLLRQWELRWEP
jgi:methylthioribose-1-phosphate isomerase